MNELEKQNCRNKIVILTSGGYFSFLIGRKLMQAFSGRLILIELSGIPGNAGKLRSLLSLIKKSGFRVTGFKVGTRLYEKVMAGVARLLGINRHLSLRSLAHSSGTPLICASTPNSETVREKIVEIAPDVVFAINVYHRIRKEMLAIPKCGVVNCHFGMLPNYRGMSPYMWALAQGEAEMGVTAHFMDEEFDTGEILAQRVIAIRKSDSAYALYKRGCYVAADMLVEIAHLADQRALVGRAQAVDGSYFSLPTRACVAAIRKNGHRLITVRDVLETGFGES